jgi:predicted RNA-binding Zn-ribbon protein involved in translation (DUF1610 family)
MIPSIEVGMKIKCLACGKPIEVSEKTMKHSWDCDFIYCPSCGRARDVKAFQQNGEIVEG